MGTYIGSRKRRRRKKPRRLAGDKGYSVPGVRDWLKRQGIDPVIPHKDNEKPRRDHKVKFDEKTYRKRCVVEQCVGWPEENRRIGTRYEKLAVHVHGVLQLAVIKRHLRILLSDRA